MPARLLRLEKPRETSTSTDRRDDLRERSARKAMRRAASRSGTGDVPGWNGPVLQAPYAAQVIAQALRIGERPRASYARTPPATAWLYDRKV
ncbi:MAG TPA: hypothetical protein VG889_00550 [Rhizomicrobium sp.]|nr:hypothetical protein [Rhizomicrobium sp.]